jgi:integrase
VVSQTFDRLVVKEGVSVISFHGLRHTHATILLKAGTPTMVVSERLGHAKTSITEDLYQHVIPGMQRDAVASFAAAVGG